jgi:hypothetical protein
MGVCDKLAPRYCGPFEILDKVGLVAYGLALPPTVKANNRQEGNPTQEKNPCTSQGAVETLWPI